MRRDEQIIPELEEIAAATRRDRLLIAAHRGKLLQMPEAPDKVAALLDTAKTLAAAGVRYALVGGVAVGIHTGVPRATADVDLAIPSTTDRDAVKAALAAAGFRLAGEFRHSVNFRHPGGEPVLLVSDAEFDPMIERAQDLSVGTERVRMVRKSDLIAMKQRAASDPTRRRSKALRDQADVELLRGDVPEEDEGW
jgi:hypothetical protein